MRGRYRHQKKALKSELAARGVPVVAANSIMRLARYWYRTCPTCGDGIPGDWQTCGAC